MQKIENAISCRPYSILRISNVGMYIVHYNCPPLYLSLLLYLSLSFPFCLLNVLPLVSFSLFPSCLSFSLSLFYSFSPGVFPSFSFPMFLPPSLTISTAPFAYPPLFSSSISPLSQGLSPLCRSCFLSSLLSLLLCLPIFISPMCLPLSLHFVPLCLPPSLPMFLLSSVFPSFSPSISSLSLPHSVSPSVSSPLSPLLSLQCSVSRPVSTCHSPLSLPVCLFPSVSPPASSLCHSLCILVP